MQKYLNVAVQKLTIILFNNFRHLYMCSNLVNYIIFIEFKNFLFHPA